MYVLGGGVLRARIRRLWRPKRAYLAAAHGLALEDTSFGAANICRQKGDKAKQADKPMPGQNWACIVVTTSQLCKKGGWEGRASKTALSESSASSRTVVIDAVSPHVGARAAWRLRNGRRTCAERLLGTERNRKGEREPPFPDVGGRVEFPRCGCDSNLRYSNACIACRRDPAPAILLL